MIFRYRNTLHDKVTNSLHMGDREYALCENMDDPHGLYYMTCVVRANDFYEFYDEVLSGDNYLQIAKLFADRIQTAIEAQITEEQKLPFGLITEDIILVLKSLRNFSIHPRDLLP